MSAKYYATHFIFGLIMLAAAGSPWIHNPGHPGNQLIALVALINCLLYPFPKLVLEVLALKIVSKAFWEKRFFAIDPVGNTKIRAIYWVFSFIFAVPVCVLSLFFMKIQTGK
ncbi:MAG: colicin E1 family microcin immunity protein [Pantoea sp.]|nr:colicin E1 family microcin immunity protein [Pantoea sp.]